MKPLKICIDSGKKKLAELAETSAAHTGNEMATPKASQHVRATLCRLPKPSQHLLTTKWRRQKLRSTCGQRFAGCRSLRSTCTERKNIVSSAQIN